jgi:DHA1 family bicyclomycin/chloramphenicol resistance-like MFS transporter
MAYVLHLFDSILQVAIGFGALLWGPASDKFGRRPILLLATALFALTNIPLILAPSIALLIVFRTLQVGRGGGWRGASVLMVGGVVWRQRW